MRIGIDLGGTKIEGVVLDREGGERARMRIPAPQGSYWATLDALCDLIGQLEHRAGVGVGSPASVGIGIPGAVSRLTGRIKNANSTWLIGKALNHDLEVRLGRPIRIENDANCMAISEAADGAAAGADPVFGVILGTGVGGAIIAGGALVRGAMAIAGEWGHNPLPVSPDPRLHGLEWPGPACYCGRNGCIETWLSGPGLAADHLRALADPRGLEPAMAAVADASRGERPDFGLSPARLVEAAHAGEPAAAATLDRWFDRLARALASVINVLDPEVIVLGGGLSRIDALYQEVPRRWGRYVFSDRVDTRIVPARHGDASGVRGAAWLWAAGS
jgi:fructokinase